MFRESHDIRPGINSCRQSSASHFPEAAAAAELKLDYAFNNDLEIALLVGEPGVGKTTLLRRFSHRLATAGHAVVDVFFPQLQPDELLAFVDGELGASNNSAGEDRHNALRRIARRARQLGREQRALVIVIDDAHLITDRDVLETLQSLLNLRDREAVRLMLLLAGEKSLLANLARVPALAGRVGVTALLAPLNLQELKSYLRQQSLGGNKNSSELDDQTLECLHRMSAGIPRTVNRICEMARLLARADGRETAKLADLESLEGEFAMGSRAA